MGGVPGAKAQAYPHIDVSQTNILNEASVFGNVTQHTLQETRVAVETTIHVAEERHQAVISAANHAHLQEMETVRREAESVRREAHNALQEMASLIQTGRPSKSCAKHAFTRT